MASDSDGFTDAWLLHVGHYVSQAARELAMQYGYRQFYTLIEVQSKTASLRLDKSIEVWIFAALVIRSDFEALYELQELPATYEYFRRKLTETQMSLLHMKRHDEAISEQLDSTLDWLNLASDLGESSLG